jgi:XTP/dITP diphosphohydrolase
MLGAGSDLLSLNELNYQEELPETHQTLEENAAEKARFVFNRFAINCFAEDTGLEIEALHGEPGVNSARYAGAHKKASDNIALVLEKMKRQANRRARFRTVICLVINQREFFFEGITEGKILTEIKGQGGFGYDSIFSPSGAILSFAEMTAEEKNEVSHRRRAIEKMNAFLAAHSPNFIT